MYWKFCRIFYLDMLFDEIIDKQSLFVDYYLVNVDSWLGR